MSGVKCFMLDPTLRVRRYLRRYTPVEIRQSKPVRNCSVHGYHDARVFVDIAEIEQDKEGCWAVGSGDGEQLLYFVGDERWPKACECGYEFVEADERQVFAARLYRRSDTGEQIELGKAPPGAMWDATWYPEDWRGPDGKALMVVLPNGDHWHIDGMASNCTKPNDKEHRCWIRHGQPPNLTVDKQGNSCAAGSGSIHAGNWHGYLRNGELVT